MKMRWNLKVFFLRLLSNLVKMFANFSKLIFTSFLSEFMTNFFIIVTIPNILSTFLHYYHFFLIILTIFFLKFMYLIFNNIFILYLPYYDTLFSIFYYFFGHSPVLKRSYFQALKKLIDSVRSWWKKSIRCLLFIWPYLLNPTQDNLI